MKYSPLTIVFTFIFCFASLIAQSVEICDNGIDDEGDQLIDLNDDDCPCYASPVAEVDLGLVTNWDMENLGCCNGLWEYSDPNCITGWPVNSSFKGSCDMFSSSCPTYYPGVGPAETQHALNTVLGATFQGGEINHQWSEFLSFPLHTVMPAGVEHCFDFWTADLMLNGMYLTFCGSVPQNQPSFDLTLYGNEFDIGPDDGLDGLNCPLDNDANWVILGTVTYTPSNDGMWTNLSICFTSATDIRDMYLGAPCLSNLPAEYSFNAPCSHYQMYDNLLLTESTGSDSFGITIEVEGQGQTSIDAGSWDLDCTGSFRLEVIADTTGCDYQWY